MTDTVGTPLPRYKCHKQVWALKIKGVASSPSDTAVRLTFEDARFAPIELPVSWANKHSPTHGGYYVVYDDGYKSFSPAKAFEDGYELIAP